MRLSLFPAIFLPRCALRAAFTKQLGVRNISSGTTNGIQWFNSSTSSRFSCAPDSRAVALTALGTVSESSTAHRHQSSYLLRLPNQSTDMLFDCGEDTESRLRMCSLAAGLRIDRIFITHVSRLQSVRCCCLGRARLRACEVTCRGPCASLLLPSVCLSSRPLPAAARRSHIRLAKPCSPVPRNAARSSPQFP